MVRVDGCQGPAAGDAPGAPRVSGRGRKRAVRRAGRPAAAGRYPGAPRFAPEYDNLVLSHADRRRVIADGDRKEVFLSSARVRATILVDGFVAGVWRIEKTKKSVALIVEPFAPLAPRDRDALAEEGERLLRFATDGQPELDVGFENAG